MSSERPDFACKPLEFLLTALRSQDRFERAEAARALCNMGLEAKASLSKLLELRHDPSYLVRIQVVRATLHLGVEPSEAMPLLLSMANDKDEIVRSYAIEALRKFGIPHEKWTGG